MSSNEFLVSNVNVILSSPSGPKGEAVQLDDPLRISPLDFISLGTYSFLGTGLGTSVKSASTLTTQPTNLFGTTKVVAVHDIFERSSTRPVLQNYLKFFSSKVLLSLSQITGPSNPCRRLVTEYTWTSTGFVVTKSWIELSVYLQQEGFQLISLPTDSLPDFVGPNVETIQLIKSFFPELDTLQLEQTPSFSSEPVLDITPYNWRTDTVKSQTTDSILIVAPVGFQTNPETIIDNHFMNETNQSNQEIQRRALLEFSAFHLNLTNAGIHVNIHVPDISDNTPDAVFPNNWFSTHPDTEVGESRILVYPMKAPLRRKERNPTLLQKISSCYSKSYDLTYFEEDPDPLFLESTGSLVLDRKNKIVYASISERCAKPVVEKWAELMNYSLVAFHSVDYGNQPIYHTNVVMGIGSDIAVVCLECVVDPIERENLKNSLAKTHRVLEISMSQMINFCGNVIELLAGTRKVLCMSSAAFTAFTDEQKDVINQCVDLICHTPIPTIESIGGGSIRCMIAEIF